MKPLRSKLRVPFFSINSNQSKSIVGSLALGLCAIAGQASDLGLVSVQFESLSANDQASIPITFGQVFAQGDVPMGMTLMAVSSTGDPIPLQVDAKAAHPDGSLRHAVLTTTLDALPAGGWEDVTLWVTSKSPSTDAVSIDDLLATDFDSTINLTIAGTLYSASARDLLAADSSTTWLDGQLVTEWMVNTPLLDPTGQLHPHLSARFNIRAYAGLERVRVDVTIENTWSYVPNPQNYTYDAQILVGGVETFAQSSLEHYPHARWRKTFWWGTAPSVHVAHDTNYLIESKAVPNYDQSITIAESALAGMESEWNAGDRGPMTIGFPQSYMPGTGGRREIGPMPRWSARYLLSMDERAKEVSLETANLAGTWSIHYRDQNTGLPVSLEDYPTMSLSSDGNPDQFPDCNGCSNPHTFDTSHQPAFAYLPYLVTGDYYYLEELQFWANMNMFQSNPNYRGAELGLFRREQIRAQAWSLRTLGQAAYITPDDHPMKLYFEDRIGYNIDWYADEYPNNPSANVLGAATNGYAYAYSNGRGIATWQDDYLTWAMGYLTDLGFDDAQPIAAWKGVFPASRMTAPGYCWIMGAPYFVRIRDSDSDPEYTDFATVYAESFTTLAGLECASQELADALGLSVGEMDGYSSSVQGYPSYMQPALAAAVQNCVPNAAQAWDIFTNRSVQPDYGLIGPEFAIVPRFDRADLDENGSVNFFDVSIFINDRIDFNHDGSFNFFDVSAFLAAMSSACS